MRAITTEQTEFNLGSHASNKEALAYIVAHGYDVGGLPQVNQSYYNTTLGCRRTWNGTIWEGHATVAGTGTAYVRLTGSDAGGDGSLADPYATILQAVEDGAVDVEDYLTIDIATAETYVLPQRCGHRGAHYNLRGYGTWTEVLGSTVLTVVRDKLLNSAADDAGRRVQLVGVAGISAHDWQFCRVEILTGNLAGLQGWVNDNTASANPEVWFDLNSNAYSDDAPGTGLVNGDTLRIIRPSTRLTRAGIWNPVGSWSTLAVGYEGAGYITPLYGGNYYFGNSSVETGENGFYSYGDLVELAIVSSAFDGYIAPWAGSKVQINGADVPNVLNALWGFTIGDNRGPWTLAWRGRNVIHLNSAYTQDIDTSVQMFCYDPNGSAASGQYLRFSGAAQGFKAYEIAPNSPTWVFPHCIGRVAARLMDIDADARDALRNSSIRFIGADVYNIAAPAYPNRCRVNGVNDVYADPSRSLEILGTGNYKRKLDFNFSGWAGDAAAGILNGMRSYDFDAAADEYIVGMGVVPPDLINSVQVFADIPFDTGADATAAHQALMDIYMALFVPGTTNVAAPPTNRYPAAASQEGFVMVTGAVNRIQRKEAFALTDADGEINSIDLAPGQPVSISILRDADGSGGGTDDLTNDLRLYADAIELYQIV